MVCLKFVDRVRHQPPRALESHCSECRPRQSRTRFRPSRIDKTRSRGGSRRSEPGQYDKRRMPGAGCQASGIRRWFDKSGRDQFITHRSGQRNLLLSAERHRSPRHGERACSKSIDVDSVPSRATVGSASSWADEAHRSLFMVPDRNCRGDILQSSRQALDDRRRWIA